MSDSWSLQLNENEWYYINLELAFNPILKLKAKPEIDEITWKVIIRDSLKSFFGVLGESTEFHVLKTYEGTKCIIRVPIPDKDIFVNSITTASVSMDSGNLLFNQMTDTSDLPNKLDGYFSIIYKSEYLVGITGPSRFNWY